MTDRFVVRCVVLGLVVALFGSLVASVVLALHGTDVPDYVKYVGTTALGAVAGVLAKTTTDDPTPVTVVGQPVETTAVPAKKTARRRGRKDAGLTSVGLVLVVLIFIAAFSLGVFAHPLWFLLLLLVVVVLVV